MSTLQRRVCVTGRTQRSHAHRPRSTEVSGSESWQLQQRQHRQGGSWGARQLQQHQQSQAAWLQPWVHQTLSAVNSSRSTTWQLTVHEGPRSWQRYKGASTAPLESAGTSLAATADTHHDPATATHTATSAVDDNDNDNDGSLNLQQPETVEATLAVEAPGMPDALAGALLSDERNNTTTAAAII